MNSYLKLSFFMIFLGIQSDNFLLRDILGVIVISQYEQF